MTNLTPEQIARGLTKAQRWWRNVLLSGLIAGTIMGFWGHYQHQRGFRLGVDTALCAWKAAVTTDGEVVPRSLRECDAILQKDSNNG